MRTVIEFGCQRSRHAATPSDVAYKICLPPANTEWQPSCSKLMRATTRYLATPDGDAQASTCGPPPLLPVTHRLGFPTTALSRAPTLSELGGAVNEPRGLLLRGHAAD